MDAQAFYRKVSPKFRAGRMARFAEAMALTPETTVLDVGGDPGIWALCPVKPKVTFLNRHKILGVPDNLMIIGDGCALNFPDRSFDIAFSNSVIEHVGDHQRQLAFARELMRVGHRVWCQTPDRTFPVELHLLAPFVHWLPKPAFEMIGPMFAIRRFFNDAESPKLMARELRLLTHSGLADLFPAAAIYRERVFGFSKSLIAVA